VARAGDVVAVAFELGAVMSFDGFSKLVQEGEELGDRCDRG
jgi:hypothetical protein